MKKMIVGSLFVVAMALGAGVLLADDGKKHDQTPTTAPSTQPSASATPVNKRCPVMPEDEVNPKITTQHEGKTIAFCCNDCIPEFKKDPAKYMKDLK